MKAQRDSLIMQAGKIVGIKVRGQGHEELVAEALDAFTKAEEKMVGTIQLIDAQIADEEKAIKEAQDRVEAANGSKAKVNRVLDRLKAFTA